MVFFAIDLPHVDTAFMYIIAGLGMIVLYQQRHPDVNANAYAAFATFAAVIFIAFMGVVSFRCCRFVARSLSNGS